MSADLGRAPLLLPAAALLAGILLGDAVLPPAAWTALGLAGLGWTLARIRRSPWLPLALLALAVGALRQQAAGRAYARTAAASRLAPDSIVTLQAGILDRMEETTPRGKILRTRWRLALDGGGLLTATLHGDAPGRPGERAALTGLYRPPRGPSNPGGFDGEDWAFHEGILGSLSIGGPEGVVSLGKAPGPLAALRRVRERLRLRLERLFPGPDGSLLGALLLGVREPLDPGLSDAFVETGTVHYLSVSGTHVVVALGILAWVLGWTPLGLKTRSALLIVAALAYAALTGMEAPVLRSSLAASLACAALLLGRPRSALNAVAAAAILIALADPGQAFRIGFQLSFLAASGILLLAGPFAERLEALFPRWERPAWLRRYVLTGLAVSLAAWLPALPLVARAFHIVTPVVLPANLLVFPLVAAVMAAGAAALVLPFAPVVGLAKALIAALSRAVEACAGIPGGHAYLGQVPIWVVLASYAWLGLLLWRIRAGRGLPLPRLAAAAALILAAALAWSLASPRPPARATMLDVGQGLCVVVQLPGGGTLLYDCGAYGRPGAGARDMAPALWALGVDRIDTLVLSHAHDDHFNGLPALASRFPVGRILTTRAALAAPTWAPAEAMRGRIPLEVAALGDRLDLGGGAWAEALHPAEDLKASPNDASLCLRVFLPAARARVGLWRSGGSRDLPAPAGGVHLLLTGDLEDLGTALLLASGREAASEVLLIPHHGGVLGPMEPLLQAARPREAWISAREGFPAPGTLAAIRAAGAAARETWKDGAVTLTIVEP